MEGSKSISGRTIPKRYIQVTGIVGEFYLENKATKVRYFSTIASGNNSAAHNLDLLKELKPMRERVKAAEMRDLGSLLQRNLNDNRVANELIPYLSNINPSIAFFPPVLAVLIPHELISSLEVGQYPTAITESGEFTDVLSYEDQWKVEVFKISGEVSNLGILSIDSEKVDIIVLDGQHRANAFRVLAGAYKEKDSSVYPAFYSKIQKPKSFKADLPVTIIWFDVEDGKIDPKIVSRRLFVDVNNHAKRVARSRTILLDESEVASLLTRFFYSKLAKEHSFNRENFSMFHSGFDIDSDIQVSSANPFALTNPQIFYDVISWLTLGSKRYNLLHCYNVSREAFRNQIGSFEQVFNSVHFSGKDIKIDEETFDSRLVVVVDSEKVRDFESEYSEKLHESVYSILSNFVLVKLHCQASAKIDDWYKDGMDSTQILVWEEVFCGGESLYYTFRDKSISSRDNSVLNRYREAMNSIEHKFKFIRASLISGSPQKDVDLAFDSIATKAFQIGLFMAFDVYKRGRTFQECDELFVQNLNKYSADQWVRILTDIRRRLMPGGATPKLWPTYQKLILRLIQNDGEEFYTRSNFIHAPEGRLFYQSIENAFMSWIDLQTDTEEISISSFKTLIPDWAKKAKNDIEELFALANLKIISADFEVETTKIIEEQIVKLNS